MSEVNVSDHDHDPGGDTIPSSETDGDIHESIKELLGNTKNVKNGVVINGVIAWVMVQNKSTALEVRKAQMSELFVDTEIEEAIDSLWNTVGGPDTLIGEQTKRNNVP